MSAGINNDFLYSAKKIMVTVTKDGKNLGYRGTGFFIKKDEENYIFVTNRHIAEPSYHDKSLEGFEITSFIIENFNDNNDIIGSLRSVNILNFNEFKYSSNINDDVACLFNPRLDKNIKVNSCIPYELLADSDFFNNKIDVCDKIAYPGFSHYYNKATNAPIFRMGTIASDPRYDYDGEKADIHSDKVAYEGFAFEGSSGAPVFLLSKGIKLGENLTSTDPNFYVELKLIGINAAYYNEIKDVYSENKKVLNLNSTEHSGISIFYKSTIIKKIIDDNIN